MTLEIISRSISTKVWNWAGIKLATPESAVLASVARQVTDCATWPSKDSSYKMDSELEGLGLFQFFGMGLKDFEN